MFTWWFKKYTYLTLNEQQLTKHLTYKNGVLKLAITAKNKYGIVKIIV